MKKWMKTAAAALTIAGVLNAGSAVMAAPSPAATLKLFINGVYQDDVLNVNGRTMVQLKAFHDPAKISYAYESSTKTIIINNPVNKITVRLKDSLKTADINGKKVALDAPVTVKRGRTYVPVRFVTETLGGTAAFDSKSKEVIVRTPTGEEQFQTLRSGELDKARVAALALSKLNFGKEIQPYGEGFTTIYTFPRGEALRYSIEYRGLMTYVEINENGLAKIKWQKDTIGKNGETGQEPKAFGESIYFMNNLMADMLHYGTVDSTGKRTEQATIDRYNNKEYEHVLIMPIEGEVRTDTKWSLRYVADPSAFKPGMEIEFPDSENEEEAEIYRQVKRNLEAIVAKDKSAFRDTLQTLDVDYFDFFLEQDRRYRFIRLATPISYPRDTSRAEVGIEFEYLSDDIVHMANYTVSLLQDKGGRWYIANID